MNKIKTKDSVRGYRINCARFEQCPLCYGCRAFDSSMIQCLKCEEENAKANICNKIRHTEKALSMMIKRPVIVLPKEYKKYFEEN